MFRKIAINDENKAWKLLKAWGYDDDLYSVEGRCFVMTVQSLNLISLSYEEANLHDDYEDLVNRMVIQQFGEEKERTDRYSVMVKSDMQSYTFQYGIKNIDKVSLQITLDCGKKSSNCVFSDDNGSVTKILQPGEFAFYMHVEAAPDADEFNIGHDVLYEEVKHY